MNFSFDVKFGDEEYLEFNKYHLFYSKPNRKVLKTRRILYLVVTLIYAFLTVLCLKYELTSYCVACIIVTVLFLLECIFAKQRLAVMLKRTIKRMKKNGKLPYTAESTVEFYDDKFISRSENKTEEMPYSVIENICDNTNCAIYIYTDVQSAKIIPYKCFRDDSEREDFLNFIKQKVNI